MTGELKPCGTAAAYKRHRENGEEPCDPCRKARRDYTREWARNSRAGYPIGECAHCRRERPIKRYGWCESCVARWQRAGRPEAGPPPLLRRPAGSRAAAEKGRVTLREQAAARREDYAWLREEQHLTIAQAADRMGVTDRTARRWEALRLKEAAA